MTVKSDIESNNVHNNVGAFYCLVPGQHPNNCYLFQFVYMRIFLIRPRIGSAAISLKKITSSKLFDGKGVQGIKK